MQNQEKASCQPLKLLFPPSAFPPWSGESCSMKLLCSFGESQLIHVQAYFCTFVSLLSSHCTILNTDRMQGREQRAAANKNVTPSLPMQLCCCSSGRLDVILVALHPTHAFLWALWLWRLESAKLIHVQEWEGQGHRHTPASCCLLFPASAGVAPSPNMTGGWSSQGNNVMGQFSRKAVNSIHKLRPSDWKGTWLRRGGEGLLWCYWFSLTDDSLTSLAAVQKSLPLCNAYLF